MHKPTKTWLIGGLAGAILCSAVFWFAPLGGPCQSAMSVLSATGESVSGLAYDGRWLWVTLDGKPVIWRMDPASGQVSLTLSFATGDTGGSAWDGRWLWQLAYLDKQIHRVDLASGRTTATIPSPGRGLCSGMTYDGRHLWVANFEDGRIYRLDPVRGVVVDSIQGNFETTGLAWDGVHLWSGILVGTKTHDEATPYTGFVQERNLSRGETLRVVSLPGVGPGTSDWLPGRGQARRFWWYDGYHRRIVRLEFPAARDTRSPADGMLPFASWAAHTGVRLRAMGARP